MARKQFYSDLVDYREWLYFLVLNGALKLFLITLECE